LKSAITGLHKALESRIRLGIMSALVVNDALDFNSIKELLQLTDGNLASHLKGLEKEGFVTVEKTFIGRKPNSLYKITIDGRTAFSLHLEALEALIRGLK